MPAASAVPVESVPSQVGQGQAPSKPSIPDALASRRIAEGRRQVYAERFQHAKAAEDKTALATEMIDAALKVSDRLQPTSTPYSK